MESYNPKNIEEKWQKKWADDKLYKTDIDTTKEKVYVLDMFPYPSGEGLHVGHPKGYIATDIYSRMKKMRGFEVLHPMGWDAFGLPAEQFALKNKIHPRIAVEKNIARFKEQLSIIGFNYDWSKEINTTDPGFYKWTQWIFKQMFKKGLAYESHEPINWCPSCKTGLANEDLEGDVCERCGTKVEKKPLRQWVLKITDYADRMIADLDKLEWPVGVKLAQKNWIGRNYGIKYRLKVKGKDIFVETYSTHYEAFYADTFAVIASDHKLLPELIKDVSNREEILKKAQEISVIRNSAGFKAEDIMEGVFTGLYLEDPITSKELPLWVSSYALPDYGTGIVKCSAHDVRDFAFAKKYNLPLHEVLEPITGKEQENPVHRESIVAIVRDGSTGKLLTLNWKEKGGRLFIGGGVEKDEDYVQTALREIQEETGYTDVEFVSATGTISHNYFAISKNEPRKIQAKGLLFELKSQARVADDLQKDEAGSFSVEWVTPDIVENEIRDELHALVYKKLVKQEPFVDFDHATLLEPAEFKGRRPHEAREEIAHYIEKKGWGTKSTQYKLKDWVFARQRYWGEPFPIVFDEQHVPYVVADSELPVRLPEVENYEPTGTGESPLAGIKDWVEVYGYLNDDQEFISCAKDDLKAKLFTRETNTMPQWAGSSWYYLRFADPHNAIALIDPVIEKKWQPVDVYVGGDHATRHLIYARFWHKFLYDLGVVSYDEPFSRLEFLGFILAEDGRKMSKRAGNVINPDDIVKKYGADTLRMYEMFMAPFDQTVAWDTKSIVGTERFLERVWKLRSLIKDSVSDNAALEAVLHKTIKKVGDDIEHFKFNTAISQMMICLNSAEKETEISASWYGTFLLLLAPFAPHITEELWAQTGNSDSIHNVSWPVYDDIKLRDEDAIIAIQIGGKLRGTVTILRDMEEQDVLAKVKETEGYKKHVGEKPFKKLVFVKNKLINIVI